jgi:hypothetical protein
MSHRHQLTDPMVFIHIDKAGTPHGICTAVAPDAIVQFYPDILASYLQLLQELACRSLHCTPADLVWSVR